MQLTKTRPQVVQVRQRCGTQPLGQRGPVPIRSGLVGKFNSCSPIGQGLGRHGIHVKVGGPAAATSKTSPTQKHQHQERKPKNKPINTQTETSVFPLCDQIKCDRFSPFEVLLPLHLGQPGGCSPEGKHLVGHILTPTRPWIEQLQRKRLRQANQLHASLVHDVNQRDQPPNLLDGVESESE